MLIRFNTKISIFRQKYNDAYGLPQNSTGDSPITEHIPAGLNQTGQVVQNENQETPQTAYFATLRVNNNVDIKRNDIVLDEVTGLKWKVDAVTQNTVNQPIPIGKRITLRRTV